MLVVPFVLMAVLVGASILSVCQLLERRGTRVSLLIPLTLFVGALALLYNGLF
jgi:hypothetical protein